MYKFLKENLKKKRFEISFTHLDYSIKDYEYFWFKKNALNRAKEGKNSVIFAYTIDTWTGKMLEFTDYRRIIK